MTRKKLQDELLDKINSQMEKLKFGLNDKNYEEQLARQIYNQNFNKDRKSSPYNNYIKY